MKKKKGSSKNSGKRPTPKGKVPAKAKPKKMPPGTFPLKVLDATIGGSLQEPEIKLTLESPIGKKRFKVKPKSGQELKLCRKDVDRLAKVCWAQAGEERLPALPRHDQWQGADDGRSANIDQVWQDVSTSNKTVFRRAAVAIAQELGFQMDKDVKVKPIELVDAEDKG